MVDVTLTGAPATTVRRAPRQWKLIRDRILVFLLILAAWELLALYVVDPIWLSRPTLIAARLYEMLLNGDLWHNTRRTLLEAVLGLTLAFVVGVPIGIALARHRYAQAVADPFLMALYSLPRVALAPLFIIWFGIDLFSKVMMAFSTVVFIFILNVQEGMKTVDRDIVDLFKTMRAPKAYLTRKVLIPWLIPWIIASLKIGVGLALIGAVVGELIGSSAGLGWYIERSAGRLDTTGVFAGLTLLMIVASLGNVSVSWLEKRVTSWRST
ncbi:MAG: ABC transporter permease [Alphaproteobacteria bacterium]|nr:ABC transporter permease [Alphaproteobacteria bacterium]